MYVHIYMCMSTLSYVSVHIPHSLYVYIYIYMYIYIYGPPPERPHLSCSGGFSSKVNSTPVSRVRVHKGRCNRENLDLYFLNSYQFLNFPQLFRAKLEPAQYDYWTGGSEVQRTLCKFPKFQKVQNFQNFRNFQNLQNFRNFQKFQNCQKVRPYVF